MSHETRYNDAVDAASKLHGDSSVSLETTLESLRGLREHVDYLIDAVEGDLKRRSRNTDDPAHFTYE